MLRASILAMLVPLAVGFCISVIPIRGHADELGRFTVGVEVADLKQQLEKGLRARRPEEFQFIDVVVTMVEGDVLPMNLVKSTFQWARKKAITTRYPFPYFERGLRLRAAKQGIKIP